MVDDSTIAYAAGATVCTSTTALYGNTVTNAGAAGTYGDQYHYFGFLLAGEDDNMRDHSVSGSNAERWWMWIY